MTSRKIEGLTWNAIEDELDQLQTTLRKVHAVSHAALDVLDQHGPGALSIADDRAEQIISLCQVTSELALHAESAIAEVLFESPVPKSAIARKVCDQTTRVHATARAACELAPLAFRRPPPDIETSATRDASARLYVLIELASELAHSALEAGRELEPAILSCHRPTPGTGTAGSSNEP